MKHIIDAEIFCQCQKCEGAVQDILRMESMLCRGAKGVLGRRRAAIRAAGRIAYDRNRYKARTQ